MRWSFVHRSKIKWYGSHFWERPSSPSRLSTSKESIKEFPYREYTLSSLCTLLTQQILPIYSLYTGIGSNLRKSVKSHTQKVPDRAHPGILVYRIPSTPHTFPSPLDTLVLHCGVGRSHVVVSAWLGRRSEGKGPKASRVSGGRPLTDRYFTLAWLYFNAQLNQTCVAFTQCRALRLPK